MNDVIPPHPILCRPTPSHPFLTKTDDERAVPVAMPAWVQNRIIRKKFRSETSNNMDSWKAEVTRVRREKIRRKKIQAHERWERRGTLKVAKHCIFLMICGSWGSKSRLAKAAGAEPAGQISDGKLHAVVARSIFWSKNLQTRPSSDHFWKLRCGKSARRCGAKHIMKSKCTKFTRFGQFLQVAMSKKYMPLWREADFETKFYKTHYVRTIFGSWDVEKVHAVVARMGHAFSTQSLGIAFYAFLPFRWLKDLWKSKVVPSEEKM